ncbi:MAG: serine/threonine protein kinase [Candidatus Xenobia bacterium]
MKNPAGPQLKTDILPFGVGDLIQGRYEVLDIAFGGMAVVYLTLDNDTHTPYAIKGLRPEMADDEEFRHRFKEEARLWVQLRHPCIVTAEMVQEISGLPYIFLEYMEGGDLASRLAELGKGLPLEEALRWAWQICSGVSYGFREAGVVHRDLKPSNVMVTLKGDVKVTDFGMARAALGEDGKRAMRNRRVHKTQLEIHSHDEETEEAVFGTLAYISPEGLFDPASVGTRSDIYSFGLMFFEMLTGRMLFGEDEMGAMLEARQDDIDIEHNDHLQQFSPPIRAILATCLRKSPARRYQSFGHLADYLSDTYREISGGKTFHLPVEPDDQAQSAANLNNRGASLANLGRSVEAETLYRQALARDPGHAKARYNLARTLLDQARHQEALELFEELLVSNRKHVSAWLGKAEVLAHLGDLHTAINICRQVYATPDFVSYQADACHTAASILERYEQWGDADQWRDLQRQLEADPTRRFTLTGGSAAFSHDGDKDNAKRVEIFRGAFAPNGFIVQVRNADQEIPKDGTPRLDVQELFEKLRLQRATGEEEHRLDPNPSTPPAGEERSRAYVIPWSEIAVVQVGKVEKSKGLRGNRPNSGNDKNHFVMGIFIPHRNLVLHFDSNRMRFRAVLGNEMDVSVAKNMLRLLKQVVQYSPRCRLSPSLREIGQDERTQVLAIGHYKSTQQFDEHGHRLMRMPRRR